MTIPFPQRLSDPSRGRKPALREDVQLGVWDGLMEPLGMMLRHQRIFRPMPHAGRTIDSSRRGAGSVGFRKGAVGDLELHSVAILDR